MTTVVRPAPQPAFERFRALGTLIAVGSAHPAALPAALDAVRSEVEACDVACSRFRDDSELSRLNAHAATHGSDFPFTASAWLCDAVATAREAAVATDGLVDPTLGGCLVRLGYDRSFEDIDPDAPLLVTAEHRPAWAGIRVDTRRATIRLPHGTVLDLGATAKALCADRAAVAAAEATGTAILVSLGGDIAVAGSAPHGGWSIRVTDRSDTPPGEPGEGQNVAIHTGALATSGTTARRWGRGARTVHHLVDPRTGRPAEEIWRTATVTAGSCVEANTASTAAVLLGRDAPTWLAGRGLDARLVSGDGIVTRIGAWPADRAGSAS